MNRAGIGKLDGGVSPEHQGALDLYRTILIIKDADPAQFWPAMPVEVRADAVGILDAVIEKLLTLSLREQLDRIGRTHNKETKS
jgi:hypothetical protein